MYLAEEIRIACQKGLEASYDQEIPLDQIALQYTKPNFAGTHTVVTYTLSRLLKQSPQKIAETLGAWLLAHYPAIESTEAIGGFLNITLKEETWWQGLLDFSLATESPTWKGKKILLEISCPNTNKPLHLGHLRNIFVGAAVANLLEALGATIIRVQHINDRGIHICKSMVAYQRLGKGTTPLSEKMKGDHFVGHYYVAFEKCYQEERKALAEAHRDETPPILKEAQAMLRKWEAQDGATLALWEKMNQWVYEGFNSTYGFLGITFDKTYYESQTYLLGKKIVEEGLAKKIFYQQEDGSIWIDLKEEGHGQKLLLRGDGTAVYITQDLGTADLRYQDYGFSEAIYVVGNEQNYHFAVLFATLKKLGRTYAEKLYHLSYGMVDLPSGKMKSREGTVVDADQIIDTMVDIAQDRIAALGKVEDFSAEGKRALAKTIGLGALKYFLLRVGVGKRILFDPEKSIDFQGDTAPFIQYTYARIVAVSRKNKYNAEELPKAVHLAEIEKQIIEELLRFHDVLDEAAVRYNPAFLTEYLYHLAKLYGRFYAEQPIGKAKNSALRACRLLLSSQTGEVLKKGMQILGIGVPDRM